MSKESRICKAKECRNRTLREGFCKIHLIQHLNGEDIVIGGSTCIIEDCSKEAVTSKGLCSRHKTQARSFGRAYTESEFKELKPELFCKVDDCLNKKGRGGYCAKHADLRKDSKEMCSKPDCHNTVLTKGLCKKHCMEGLDFSKLKDVVTPHNKEYSESDKWCKIKSCSSHAKYEGFCLLHAVLILHDSLNEYLGKEGRICSVESCNGIVKAKGYCLMHYQRYLKFGKGLTNKEHKAITPRYYCIEDECEEKREYGEYCGKHAVEHMNDQKAICFEKPCKENIFKDGKCVKHYYDSLKTKR
ncbi:hypothetical protein bcgnr5378_06240 [Bacillus cereus]|uniref:Cysteine-rich protein n=1 Tax=Bacillus cereus TaxID=1396 RepID=A0A164LAP2_BACCE|nr:hypothetical protein [Bacillus cereus]KZD55607.1 Cysteine-rich protein [Bacillus cereus]